MAIKAKPNKLAFKDSEKARTNITKDQIKEISKLYEQWADDIAKLADKYKNKTTSSSVVQERQLRELEKQIRSAGQNASNEVYKNVKKNIHIVSSNVVKTNKKWLQSLGFKGIEKSLAFSYVPEEVVKKLITGQIYETGWSLSKAIWGDNEDTMKSIYRIVAGGRAENKSSYEIAKDLEEFVRPSAKKKWNLKDKDGRYIYPKQVDYNAQRLARTLTQHAYQQSFIETTKDNPLITSYKWISNGSRVCEICKERDGRIYEKDKLPMDHPNGMCVMQPVVNKDAKKEIADWIKGKENKDLDKFAKKMGYKPRTGNKVKVKKQKTAQFTGMQKKYLESYGYDTNTIPTFDQWFEKATIKDIDSLDSLAAKANMTLEEFYKKKLGKVKYKYIDAVEDKIQEKAQTVKNKVKFEKEKWLDKIKSQTEEMMLKKEESLFNKFTSTQRDSLETYSSSAYRQMNGYLRKKAAGLPSDISDNLLKDIKNCQEALSKVGFDEDLVLRRGTDLGDLAGFMAGNFEDNLSKLKTMSLEELKNKFEGTVGSYAGFTSTSSLFNRGFSGSVEMILYAPKGAAGSSIMKISRYGTAEGETLLNADTKIKILNIEKSDWHMGSRLRVFAEILI